MQRKLKRVSGVGSVCHSEQEKCGLGQSTVLRLTWWKKEQMQRSFRSWWRAVRCKCVVRGKEKSRCVFKIIGTTHTKPKDGSLAWGQGKGVDVWVTTMRWWQFGADTWQEGVLVSENKKEKRRTRRLALRNRLGPQTCAESQWIETSEWQGGEKRHEKETWCSFDFSERQQRGCFMSLWSWWK